MNVEEMLGPQQEAPRFGRIDASVTYLDRPSVYALCVDLRGGIALVHTPTGCLLPGGGIDPGETALEALCREVLEETGHRLHVLNLIGRSDQFLYSAKKNVYFKKRGEFYLCQLGEWRQPSSEYDHHLRWHPLNEAIDLLTYEFHQWAVKVLVASK